MLDFVKMAGARAYPPRVSAATEPFWAGLAAGRWMTTQCEGCARLTFPPKAICPHCWSSKVGWTEMGSRGMLYSWTRVHSAPTVFASEAPYCVCIVDLDCGLRLACRLVERPDMPIRIGSGVEIVRLQYDDGDLFAARPVGGES